MAVKIKPMTKTQLVEYFRVYRDAFPDWRVEHDVVLVRSNGPIKQHIAFEALRAGSYRPSCSIQVLVAPEVRLLTRFLDIKHRELLPRDHSAKWPDMVKAMEEQFLPSVRKALNTAEVLQLGEEAVARDKIDNINYSSGLAALNAYVGNMDRALWWCERINTQLAAKEREPADWEQHLATFAQQLREAITTGRVQSFFRERAEPRSN